MKSSNSFRGLRRHKNYVENLGNKREKILQKLDKNYPSKIIKSNIKKVTKEKKRQENTFKIIKKTIENKSEHKSISSFTEKRIPYISFIIAFYNNAPYIERCINSILNQTVKNIEIILVNDGSTDNVEPILETYKEKYSNIKVINKENKGVSAARNIGIKNSNGLYLAFIDGDDYITPDMSEYLLDRCLKYNLDACYFDFKFIDVSTNKILKAAYHFKNFLSEFKFEKVISPYDIKLDILCSSMAMGIYKRKIFIDNNITFNEEVEFGEDFLVKFDYFYLYKRIMFVNKEFYIYCRNRNDSATTTINRHIDRIIVFLNNIIKMYLRHLINDSRNNSQYINLILREITHYVRILKCQKTDEWCQNNLYLIDPDLILNNDINQLYINRLKEIIDLRKFNSLYDKVSFYRSKLEKTYYIITGQLNSTENESIDSWLFFKYLRQNNIDSIYICWKNHKSYAEYKKLYPEYVIGMNGNCVTDEEFFSSRLFPYIVRSKFLIQENSALNSNIEKYIYNCKDFCRVFLGHGITVSNDINYLKFLDIYNVSSDNEKKIVKEAVTHTKLNNNNFVIAGLPRYDYLKDEYDSQRKYAFIMFTWRYTFTDSLKIQDSDYLKNILNLVNEDNINKLRSNGIIPVLCIHHHILNKLKLKLNLDNVIIPESTQISSYIRKSFVCVTDYSSVNYDFRFLNKPVIFWTPDLNSSKLSNVDLQKQSICIKRLSIFNDAVTDIDSVIHKIICYSKNPYLPKDKIILNNSFFKYRKNISEHLYNELERMYSRLKN